MVSRTWPGMEVEYPDLVDHISNRLTMFCRENRMTREIYWSGFGFQVWCQLLTHISRARLSTMLVVDEPEIYLHPDVQRQLVSILRDVDPDIVVATHSSEIIGESDPTEILLVDKSRSSATRLRDIGQVQATLEAMGSVHNVVLTHLARTGRLLYVENVQDDKIIRRFARIFGFTEVASGSDITIVPSEGFGSWKKIESSAWAFERVLQGKFGIGAVFDRDYFCTEQIEDIQGRLATHYCPVHVHERKEIENYLLAPVPLDKAIRKAVRERNRRTGKSDNRPFDASALLWEISESFKDEVISQLVGKRSDYFRSSGKDIATITKEVFGYISGMWNCLDNRLKLIPGKKVLREFRDRIMETHSINLTDFRIIDEFRPDDVPHDFQLLLNELDKFRKK